MNLRVTDPHESAFPATEQLNGNGHVMVYASPGMSTRAYMATHILAGLVAGHYDQTAESDVVAAVRITDLLIDELNKAQ